MRNVICAKLLPDNLIEVDPSKAMMTCLMGSVFASTETVEPVQIMENGRVSLCEKTTLALAKGDYAYVAFDNPVLIRERKKK